MVAATTTVATPTSTVVPQRSGVHRTARCWYSVGVRNLDVCEWRALRRSHLIVEIVSLGRLFERETEIIHRCTSDSREKRVANSWGKFESLPVCDRGDEAFIVFYKGEKTFRRDGLEVRWKERVKRDVLYRVPPCARCVTSASTVIARVPYDCVLAIWEKRRSDLKCACLDNNSRLFRSPVCSIRRFSLWRFDLFAAPSMTYR